jgi:hypothetical protein
MHSVSDDLEGQRIRPRLAFSEPSPERHVKGGMVLHEGHVYWTHVHPPRERRRRDRHHADENHAYGN